ncbi:MAG: GIY-YIG nuclease family protein [Patescibacteria group bacterium]
MYYIYVIKSLIHNTRYVGSTDRIEKRISEHNLGKCRYTSGRQPWKLIYQEEYKTRGEAMKREKFLKSGIGRKYLDKVLKQL